MVYLLTLMLCALMFLICYVGTGNEKNVKNINSYPDDVKKALKQIPKYKDKIKEPSKGSAVKGFLMNLVIYSVLIFLFGLSVKSTDYFENFINLSIMGQGLNLFDLLVIDLLWWRNSRRVRFSGTEDNDELYKDPKNHIKSFLKGIVLFLIIAALDGFLLTLI